MKKVSYWKIVGIAIPALVWSGCSTPVMVTKAQKFPEMYNETPLTVLVLPPINETTAADAKDYYATTIGEPLAFSGFYVLPNVITDEILKSQGLYDTELLLEQPLHRFGEYFGADAVLFTRITHWHKSYVVLASTLTVSIDASLKSTRSNEVLWRYTGTIVADLSGSGGGSGNPLVDLAVKALVTAVNTAVADYVPYAQLANRTMLQTVPVGAYHARFGLDREDKFVDIHVDDEVLVSNAAGEDAL